jgi:hypothetical protein
VEPVTGLSRRALVALGIVLVLGVVASTVATALSADPDPGCIDAAYDCATFRAGEPVVLGVLSNRDDVDRAVRLVAELWGHDLGGRPLRVLAWDDRCTPEGGSRGARELATDSPDEPPVLAVVGATCRAAITPAAQILSDSGVTLVSISGTPVPRAAGRPRYYLGLGPRPAVPLQSFEAVYAQRYGPPDPRAVASAYTTDWILRTARSLFRRTADGAVVVPRTQLRDGLIEAGFVRIT